MSRETEQELTRDEYTEYIYSETCFGEPVNADAAEDMAEGVSRAIELDKRPVFLEGLAARLTQLGTECSPQDTDIMLSEVKQRYRSVLGKPCPRTVQEWCKGRTPGITNRQNNYDLCYALEMDYQQTAVFFQKHYLSLPFIIKARVDAVFLYCLYHRRPYCTVIKLLESSKGFVSQENAHTSTSQIADAIFDTDDDEKFLRYLSEHCYDNEQQFQLARSVINEEIDILKAGLLDDTAASITSPDRLNSMTIDALFGYRYQARDKGEPVIKLPKRFTESLPNDVTLGRMINGDSISYEVLRKSLMLLKFYNYYHAAEVEDRARGYEPDNREINNRLLDFYDELNSTLISCGFAQLYVLHPFDCLLLYCANSYDPIQTLHALNERN
ncbi:MAG: hypothetical protein IKP75_04800 [Oscillospiraceae bacterium]|nr:hypothetical protein [Oscillospiraceae bacterium]